MDSIILSACRIYGVDPADIMRPHASGAARTLKPMLWFYLLRHCRIPHRRVAARFGCSRTNVLAVVRSFAGAIALQPSLQASYRSFAAALSSSL